MKTYSQFTTEGNLRKWFKGSKSVDGKPGWVEVISGEPCAREKGEEDETPKCVSSDKRTSMTKSERISAQRRKSAADPNQPEKSGAAKPTYVPTDKPKKKMNEEKDIKGKGSGEKDACYRKVKSRYSVWPSAYASGALVKCRKVGAANWGNTSEDFVPRTLKTYSEFIAEAKQAKPPKEVLRKIDRAYGRKHPGVNVDVSHDEKTGDLRVNQLFVPPDKQGKGIGTRVMKGLTKYADKQKKRMTLTQDPDKGKKAKLAKFYKSHGFEKNRGRSRDFTTRDTDIRNPKS